MSGADDDGRVLFNGRGSWNDLERGVGGRFEWEIWHNADRPDRQFRVYATVGPPGRAVDGRMIDETRQTLQGALALVGKVIAPEATE